MIRGTFSSMSFRSGTSALASLIHGYGYLQFIQSASRRIVNILGGGSIDYSQ